MEKWIAYKKINLQIDIIESFIGGNQELRVCCQDKKKSKWVLHFDDVWDFRYAIENAFINRSYEKDDCAEESSIFVVENSEYIKYFENQVCHTRPTDELKHFLIFDTIDTGLEILTTQEPVLQKD